MALKLDFRQINLLIDKTTWLYHLGMFRGVLKEHPESLFSINPGMCNKFIKYNQDYHW